jgi:voltage-gated potassium channel Kch
MSRLASAGRDMRVVGRALWANAALYLSLLMGAAAVMRICGCYPEASFLELVVDSFHMSHLERVVEPGDGAVPSMLTFAVPLLSVVILGEGALRVARVYLQRGERREEWDRMVAETFFEHTVLCGVGELGRAVFQRLIVADPDAEVVLVDSRPGVLAELGQVGSNVCHMQGDMTSIDTLKAAQCHEARLIILASGNDAFNLEAGFKALQLNPQAQIWIRLYRSGLASVMDLRTKPNIHFFSPYERAAEALVEHVAGIGNEAPRARP